ncbi:MAG: exodeoxyribonuclease VII large subunit [Mycobacterium sp.]
MSAELGTADNPYPVRSVATRVQGWIERLGVVWVEGQLTEIAVRGATTFMVLRDPAADMSLRVNCRTDLVRSAPVKLAEGVQVVVCAKPQFDPRRGSFSLRLSEIRAVGLGELLARIEMLRRVLDAEGLFDPRLKRPLPFLPNLVGLITGRGGAAEHDVTTVAAGRWPAVRFEIRNTAVQGAGAVAQIVEALRELDGHPEVDVIVIARGGGSVEDLLPFSDETLCRAIAACRTPVVSAVGHEPDNPLCDLVADLRAATPTDAAKKVVPDTAAELALVAELRQRSARALRNWVGREQHSLTQLRSRPSLADPLRLVTDRAAEVTRALAAARRDVIRQVDGETDRVGHLAARLSTLGPAATLARGYAVVQTVDETGGGASSVLRSTADAPGGTALRIRLADGAIGAVSTGQDGAA